VARRVLGWTVIVTGMLLVMAGFAHLCFIAIRSGGSVWNASHGLWDDYLLMLGCFGLGAFIFRKGDKLAGWPFRTRNRALVHAGAFERGQRINGCFVFFIGLSLLALILFMAIGAVVDSGGREWGSVFVAVWALPLLWIMRAGWRRFSGRGWFGGDLRD
jgi:hypothetical protein